MLAWPFSFASRWDCVTPRQAQGVPFDGLRAGCEPLSLAGTAVLGFARHVRSKPRRSTGYSIDICTARSASDLSRVHGSPHRDRRDENLGPQLVRSCPAALYGSLPALSPSKGECHVRAARVGPPQIPSLVHDAPRREKPFRVVGCEASHVTVAVRSQPRPRSLKRGVLVSTRPTPCSGSFRLGIRWLAAGPVSGLLRD